MTDFTKEKRDLFSYAIKLALEAHKDQTRIEGEPYITHPLAVMSLVHTADEMIVAILHDVFEDCDDTILHDAIYDSFPSHIIEALQLLTHEEGVEYMDYIKELTPNELARNVKLADMAHNLSTVTNLPKHRRQYFVDKYRKARNYILGYIQVNGRAESTAGSGDAGIS